MKKFMLFSGETFYPSGGMKDYVYSFDTLKEARAYIQCTHQSFMMHWHHVADRDTGEIVWDWVDVDD